MYLEMNCLCGGPEVIQHIGQLPVLNHICRRISEWCKCFCPSWTL